jgi:hypothetical protein
MSVAPVESERIDGRTRTVGLKDTAAFEAPTTDLDVLSRAETAECTCPDFCERDHANE